MLATFRVLQTPRWLSAVSRRSVQPSLQSSLSGPRGKPTFHIQVVEVWPPFFFSISASHAPPYRYSDTSEILTRPVAILLVSHFSASVTLYRTRKLFGPLHFSCHPERQAGISTAMEKYCFWEYLDGTIGAAGQEARFMVPATRRFGQLTRHSASNSPRIIAMNPILRAFCAATPELKVLLSGDAFIDTEEQWKWLNSVLAQYLGDRALIPSCRDGSLEVFVLGVSIQRRLS